MFITPDQIIDSVQNAKKHIVNTFVVDAKIKQGLVEVIDAQTALAKTMAKNTLSFAELFVKNFAVGSAK